MWFVALDVEAYYHCLKAKATEPFLYFMSNEPSVTFSD